MPLEGYGIPNTGAYEQESRDLNYRFGTESATNAYGRFLSQQRGSRDLGNLQRGFSRQLPGYKASFGQRGLSQPGVKSGTVRRSMGNFLGDYAREYQGAQQELTGELQGYDLAQANLQAWLNNSQADLATRKQNDIANAALAIEALKPYLGSL